MRSQQQQPLLYVEDDTDYAELVVRMLAQQAPGPPVRHVRDGRAAIDYVFRSIDDTALRPRLILLDLRLPKIDGFEVLRVIKSDRVLRNIPTIVLSTSADQRDLQRAYEHHVNSYLVKPEGYIGLDQLLREIGSYWLTRNLTAGASE